LNEESASRQGACSGFSRSSEDGNQIFTEFGKPSSHGGSACPRGDSMVQLRLLVDIVAFDLTHVYLMLDVLNKRVEDVESVDELVSSYAQKHAILKFTLPECHVFLRALREFHGLIEVTTPVLEEARRIKSQRPHHANGSSETAAQEEGPLDSILQRLNTRAAERPSEAQA
jgi:hypothetical protein